VKNVSLAARSSPIRLPAAFAVGVMPNANLLAQCDPRRSRFLRDGAGRYGTLRESAESGERRAVTRRSASLLANSRSTSIRLAGVQIPSGTPYSTRVFWPKIAAPLRRGKKVGEVCWGHRSLKNSWREMPAPSRMELSVFGLRLVPLWQGTLTIPGLVG
jgi:hypothetical protein